MDGDVLDTKNTLTVLTYFTHTRLIGLEMNYPSIGENYFVERKCIYFFFAFRWCWLCVCVWNNRFFSFDKCRTLEGIFHSCLFVCSPTTSVNNQFFFAPLHRNHLITDNLIPYGFFLLLIMLHSIHTCFTWWQIFLCFVSIWFSTQSFIIFLAILVQWIYDDDDGRHTTTKKNRVLLMFYYHCLSWWF